MGSMGVRFMQYRSKREFLHNAVNKGALLLLAILLALLIVNSQYCEMYDVFLRKNFTLQIANIFLKFSITEWINDFLMIIFFLNVTLDVKHEVIEGDLSCRSQRILAFIASTSGVIVPALIYYAINHSTPNTLIGWAIPTGTDIAFVLGAMAFLKSNVPSSLYAFASASVIIDDLIAILIIAIFYTQTISYAHICYALICTCALLVLNYVNVRSRVLYLLYTTLGIILWYCCYLSGIHTTMTGVILGALIPVNTCDGKNMLQHVKNITTPITMYVIVPLFAFVNGGIQFSYSSLCNAISSPIALGVLFGLLIGKPLGIFGSSVLMIKYKLVKMPNSANLLQLFAISVLCGIGFTVTLFIATLAFDTNAQYLLDAKIGMLFGSLTAFCLGAYLLSSAGAKKLVK